MNPQASGPGRQAIPARRLDERALPGLHDFVFERVLRRYALPGAQAADLGAGAGAMSARLRALGLDVTAVDLDEDRFRGDTPFVRADLNDPDFARALGEGTFSLVVAIEVIEHLESPAGFLRNVRRLLRPEGVAILTTPNVESFPARLEFLLLGTLRMMDGRSDPTHLSPLFTNLLRTRMLPRVGLELSEHLLYPPTGFRASPRPWSWFFRVGAAILPGNAAHGDIHVFVLRTERAGHAPVPSPA